MLGGPPAGSIGRGTDWITLDEVADLGEEGEEGECMRPVVGESNGMALPLPDSCRVLPARFSSWLRALSRYLLGASPACREVSGVRTGIWGVSTGMEGEGTPPPVSGKSRPLGKLEELVGCPLFSVGCPNPLSRLIRSGGAVEVEGGAVRSLKKSESASPSSCCFCKESSKSEI